MGRTNWQYIIDGVAAIFGLYVFISAAKMKITGEISSFVASPEEIVGCRDKKTFAQEMAVKMMAFGLLTWLFGLINFINEFLWKNKIISIVMAVLYLAGCGWFLSFQRKMRDKYLNLS